MKNEIFYNKLITIFWIKYKWLKIFEIKYKLKSIININIKSIFDFFHKNITIKYKFQNINWILSIENKAKINLQRYDFKFK